MAEDCVGETAQKAASQMKPKDVLLLENVRFHAEEEKNDSEFAKNLPSWPIYLLTMLLCT